VECTVPVIRSPSWVRLKYVRRNVPSVGFGTAATQLPVMFGCAGAAVGAAATGAGVTTTGVDEQPATSAITSAVTIDRMEQVCIGVCGR
jgi:hypothetical protein